MSDFRFYLPEHDETVDDAREARQPVYRRMTTAQDAAIVAADYYHARCDGWEASWPVLFAILDASGQETRFLVHREMVPEFNAEPQP